MLYLQIAGMTLSLIGKLLLIVIGLWIHSNHVKAKRENNETVREYRLERGVALFVMLILVVGYVFELVGRDLLPL